jgi:hypothetical protein
VEKKERLMDTLQYPALYSVLTLTVHANKDWGGGLSLDTLGGKEGESISSSCNYSVKGFVYESQ